MASFIFWGKSRTKASLSHLQLSLFEGSLAQKLRVHIFHFHFMREVPVSHVHVSEDVPFLVRMWKDVNTPPHPSPPHPSPPHPPHPHPRCACWWIWVIVTERHYLVHVSVKVPILVRMWQDVNIHPTPPHAPPHLTPHHPRCACCFYDFMWYFSAIFFLYGAMIVPPFRT